MKRLIPLLLILALMGCKESQYQAEKSCKDKVTGKYVSPDLCK